MSEYSDPRNIPDDPTAIEAPAIEDQPGYAEPIEGEKPNTETQHHEAPKPEDQPGYAEPEVPEPLAEGDRRQLAPEAEDAAEEPEPEAEPAKPAAHAHKATKKA